MLNQIESLFPQVAPKVDFCSLRFVSERQEYLAVRQNVPQPARAASDVGVMITVIHNGGLGYASTSDLTLAGLQWAAEQAEWWAGQSAGRSVVDFRRIAMPPPAAEYVGPEQTPWETVPPSGKFDMLIAECKRLKVDDRIVDWESAIWFTRKETLYLTAGGGRVYQRFSYMVPFLSATANEKTVTQHRTLGGRSYSRQGGMEVLDAVGFRTEAPRIGQEALDLLSAPNCPSGKMDVLLAPDQMILQIHESIGHPLELDRILGDERNYAGTSFVKPEMFGTYRYGSKLLNITYDPTRPEQFSSFAFDDDGLKAERQFLIEHGILKRGLGGITSQIRSGIPGVANARASSWNRPPIDRMANLNLEPGDKSLDQMIAMIKRGIYMKTNTSWSIDDSRNKFQFGCEWAQLIEHGRLTTVVKNPNYRGISATFWRSLKAVGDQSTSEVLGTPNCGKGEPNQVMRVGHATPACVFKDVDVFGGE
ncbi:MAG TPA: TldD/PmbA family protein [Planctomycetota bacterium]|nr:TldD/PmbA family protein [Planctomycetota bacterium]